jgi:NADH-quinone oxidoreductase subunit E
LTPEQLTKKNSPKFFQGRDSMMIKNKTQIDQILDKYVGFKGALIPILQEIQELEGYLSKEIMRYVAEKTNIRAAHIFGVATFYTMFRLQPQGKHTIRVCKGTACHVSNADSIANAVRWELKLKPDESTSKSKLFTIMEVACLGCCSLAPVMMIDADTHGKLVPEKIAAILKKYS